MIAIDSAPLTHLSWIGRLDSDRAAGSAWIEAGGGWEGLWSILRNYM